MNEAASAKKNRPGKAKIGNGVGSRIHNWLCSSSFKCGLMSIAASLIILVLFFTVCAPKKYDLKIGAVAHESIRAPKDVVDEIATQEKKEAAAALVEPVYHFQPGVKEEVMNSLHACFNELRTVQQYGLTLRTGESGRSVNNIFSEDEIDYAYSLLDDVSLTRNQIITLLRIDTPVFDEMVSTVSIAVENSLNTTVREGQVSQSIQTILQIVGYKLDVSLTQNILPTVLRLCIKPNMTIDQDATDEARNKAMEAIEPVVILQGELIIQEGDTITPGQIQVLRTLGLLNDSTYDYSVYGGSAIAVLLSMICLYMMLKLLCSDILTDVRKMAVILLVLILSVAFAAISHLLPSQFIIPLAFSCILGTVLIGYRIGICLTVTSALLFASLTSGNNTSSFYDVVLFMSMTLAEGIISIWFLKGRPQRVRVLIAGILSAVVGLVLVIGIKWMTSAESLDILSIGLWTVGGGILSGLLAVALQPAFETAFRLATSSRLLELTNPNQPLMKRLMIEAPGTYHHSIIVANLAEAAADKIHANPFLARAGAYYHDIGKLKRPGYFKENQNGDNPHERTDPYVSAAILTSHTMDGVLMAQKEHMPKEIQNIILQHHGDTPVMFFYHKALQLSNGNHVDINEFRYAGPKPNTKEAAIVMLADTIEAAVRSMKDPTPKGIDQFIERLVRGKLEDGQLSNSPLSLRDIDQICAAFSGILKGVYHERIEYPTVRHYAVQQAVSADSQKDAPSASVPSTANESVPAATAADKAQSDSVQSSKEVIENEA